MKKDKWIVVIHKYAIFGLFAIGLLLSDCASTKATREGYSLYKKYGFSFEYPQSFHITEEGLPYGRATDKSGAVTAFRQTSKENEFFLVTWQDAPKSIVGSVEQQFVDFTLKSSMTVIALVIGNKIPLENMDQITYSDQVSSTKLGHYYAYQEISMIVPSSGGNIYANMVIGC
jgi:hypothetical protein